MPWTNAPWHMKSLPTHQTLASTHAAVHAVPEMSGPQVGTGSTNHRSPASGVGSPHTAIGLQPTRSSVPYSHSMLASHADPCGGIVAGHGGQLGGIGERTTSTKVASAQSMVNDMSAFASGVVSFAASTPPSSVTTSSHANTHARSGK